MTKKKLLIASDTFLPRWDGVTRFLLEVVPKLSLKYDITLAVPDFKGKSVRIKNVNIVRIPVYNFIVDDMQLPKFKFRMIKRLVKESDIVFIQALGPIGALAASYAGKQKKPLYAYAHIVEWDLYPKVIRRFEKLFRLIMIAIARHFYNKCDLIMVPSTDIEKELVQAGIKPQKKIIPLGVNQDEFVPAENKDDAKKKANIDPKNIVVGFAGRIGWEKDLGTLYKAYSILQKKYAGMLKLLIVGSGVKIEKFFKSMEDVIHIEATHNVVDYLQAMDIFVMPSIAETSSLATMEAMSCSLPVVATNIGCMKLYIKDGKNGYIFPPGDYEVLAGKLSKLVDNAELRKAIGLMARKTITLKFSWDHTIKEIEKTIG